MISKEDIAHWKLHAVSESWEHIAIQRLLEERANTEKATEPKPIRTAKAFGAATRNIEE